MVAVEWDNFHFQSLEKDQGTGWGADHSGPEEGQAIMNFEFLLCRPEYEGGSKDGGRRQGTGQSSR